MIFGRASSADERSRRLGDPGREGLTDLVVDGLATYRLVKLIRDDRISAPVRDAVLEAKGSPDQSKLSYLLTCPWCLSFYFGAALTVGRRLWPSATDAVAHTFALSALAGLGAQYLDQD